MNKNTFKENEKYNEVAWGFQKFVENALKKNYDVASYDEERSIFKFDKEFYKKNGYGEISINVGLPSSDKYDRLKMYIDVGNLRGIYTNANKKESIDRYFDRLKESIGDVMYIIDIGDFVLFRDFKTLDGVEKHVNEINKAYEENGIRTRCTVDGIIGEYSSKFTIFKHTANSITSNFSSKQERFIKAFDKFLRNTIREYIDDVKSDGRQLIIELT